MGLLTNKVSYISTRLLEPAMSSEINWSGPLKAAAVETAVGDEPGLYQFCAKTPRILFSVGAAGEGLKKRLLAVSAQEDGATEESRHLSTDVEVGAVFGFDVKMQDHRKGFLARDCYFLIHPMPGAAQADLDRALAQLQPMLSPRYAGQIGRYKTIEW